jgi:AAA family ATP:ADP antiporter
LVITSIMNLFSSVFTGFESPEEKRKFSILAVLFGLTIGVYWLFRPLKDSIFLTMVGREYQPWAKMLSILVTACAVLIYSQLVDKYPRHKLLYGYSVFYALCSIGFAFFIFDPQTGIANTVEDPHRYLGWVFYLFVESFGSTMVALFWSFVADTTTPDSARRGYSLIVFGAQSGGVIIPLMGKILINVSSSGSAILLCVVGICCIPVGVYYFMHTVPHAQLKGFEGSKDALEKGKKSRTGFLDGLYLVATRPYVLGIFVMVAFYEIVIVMIDFQFKWLAKAAYTGDALTNFFTTYAICINVVAVLSVLLGSKGITRRLGLGNTLLLLPVMVGASAIIVNMNPVLAVAFGVMVACKSINYSLNQPAKEQLYIPTSKDTKYKAKAWIDMFGIRLSKGTASGINTLRPLLGVATFTIMSLGLSAMLIMVWFLAAMFIGKEHRKAIKEDRIVC